MNNIVEVEFDGISQTCFFRNNNFDLKKNITVIVDSDRGYQFGRVINVISDVEKFNDVNLYSVVRISTKKDYLKHKNNINEIDEVLSKCRDIVSKNGLSMNILDGNYNFDRSQLLFRFVADERVDFRQLAKELGAVFKTRIELRQIGIRDKAKEVSGIGPCGRRICCSSFLKSFDSITINMAKNQNVSLNPTKINGVCGRLLCCLKYENDNYVELKKTLPQVGKKISYNGRNAKVLSVDIFKNRYKLELDDKSLIEVDNYEGKK